MCDYSLEAYRTRPAQTGEKYVTHRFDRGSIGLASPADCTTAVCMQPDTKLRLEGIPEDVQRRFGVSGEEEVTFVRLDQGPYHDGIRFENGVEITLQTLRTGVSATITRAIERAVEIEALVPAE